MLAASRISGSRCSGHISTESVLRRSAKTSRATRAFAAESKGDSAHNERTIELSKTPSGVIQRRSAFRAAAILGVSQALTSLLSRTQSAHAELFSEATLNGSETDITDQVELLISIAPRSFKLAEQRTLGDKSVIPLEEGVPLGRIVLGLYGNAAPGTVSNFLRLIRSGALNNTVFSRVLPGEYIQAGQQGAYRLGQVETIAADLQPNPDLSSPTGFKARHLRPGTLSLSLSENDEDPIIKGRQGYRNTEFLITTGPGPVPRLDGANLVFGRVLEGMSTVSNITQVPTFKPSAQNKQMNGFAQSIGDDRAAGVRRKYGKPLKAVIITQAREIPNTATAAAPAMTTPAVTAAASPSMAGSR